jgi:hypothetical protein
MLGWPLSRGLGRWRSPERAVIPDVSGLPPPPEGSLTFMDEILTFDDDPLTYEPE